MGQEVMSDLETRVAERSGEAALGNLPMIDTERLQIPNLLQNLVSNAFKYRQREMSPAVIVSGYSQRTLRCDSTPQLMVRFRHEGLELCVFDISAATQQAQSTRRPAWALRFEDDQKR